MPQGLCNAVAMFQWYINWVLRECVGRFCAVYIDDIAIWSNSVEEHEEHVRLILEALREAGICASKKKSVLFADEISFLGHTISSRGVEVAQKKVDKILASRTPTCASDIKEFNGLVNYMVSSFPVYQNGPQSSPASPRKTSNLIGKPFMRKPSKISNDSRKIHQYASRSTTTILTRLCSSPMQAIEV